MLHFRVPKHLKRSLSSLISQTFADNKTFFPPLFSQNMKEIKDYFFCLRLFRQHAKQRREKSSPEELLCNRGDGREQSRITMLAVMLTTGTHDYIRHAGTSVNVNFTGVYISEPWSINKKSDSRSEGFKSQQSVDGLILYVPNRL